MKIEDKREHEIRLVSEMIELYYRSHEGDPERLIEYAKKRILVCPFMEQKTFCSSCQVHCYQKEMREEIWKVMRYSGPRLIFRHPLLVFKHGYISMKENWKKKKVKKRGNV